MSVQIYLMNKYIWWAKENNCLVAYKSFESGDEWIPAIRNKAEINLSLLLKLKCFFNLALFSSRNQNEREKKANQQLYVNWVVLERCNLTFLVSRTFETIFRKLSILPKIWKWRLHWRCYFRQYDALRIKINMWLTL